MTEITYERLEKVLNMIYSPSFRRSLREKYDLVKINNDISKFNDIDFYLRRNLIVGINGNIHEHKTTGPCLLPTVDIKLLNKKDIDVQEILDRQPTIQNVLLTATAAKGPVHTCLETKEFSNLLNEIRNKKDDNLDAIIEVAKRTMKINKRLLKWWNVSNSDIRLHYTHDSKIDESINEYCHAYGEIYLKYLEQHDPKSNNFRISKRIRKILQQGKRINEIYRIRIVSTYFPGWWGDTNVKEHTVIENVFHDAQLFTRLHSDTSMVGLLPPKDLSFKKSEMDVGVPLYLGTEEMINEGIELLRLTKFPRKNRFNCIVGNLLLFAVKRVDDFHSIESCEKDKETCNQDCRECLNFLEEFIHTISC